MTDQSKPYTPLTADNSALVLVDHQVGLMTGVRDYETGELKHNVVALAAGGNRDGRGGGEAENGGSVNWAFMRPMLNAPRATGCTTRSPRTDTAAVPVLAPVAPRRHRGVGQPLHHA